MTIASDTVNLMGWFDALGVVDAHADASVRLRILLDASKSSRQVSDTLIEYTMQDDSKILYSTTACKFEEVDDQCRIIT